MFIPFATSSIYIPEYYNMTRPLPHFGNLISIHFGLLESDLLDLSLNWKTTLTFGFPVSHLLSKSGISSSFHLAQSFLELFLFLETHCRFELNFMISWGMVSDKVTVVSAGWILRILRVTDRKYREWLARLEKSKILKLYLKNAFREPLSKILFRFS